MAGDWRQRGAAPATGGWWRGAGVVVGEDEFFLSFFLFVLIYI